MLSNWKCVRSLSVKVGKELFFEPENEVLSDAPFVVSRGKSCVLIMMGFQPKQYLAPILS